MTAAGLRLAPDLVLPIDAVTGTFAVFANRGKGKSNTCTALVEELYAAKLPVVILDVKGDWWGLRSNFAGDGPGLPFIIFGGDHGDLRLEPTAGTLFADLVVDERIHAVLDMSDMSKGQARSFTTAFAERLYKRNRDPLHLIVDEADVLIPQRASQETARLLGAMEDIAKRGRQRGIGMTIASQRVQDIATPVRDLMETLIIGNTSGFRAISALKDWISVHADENTTTADVIKSLPTLAVGVAWIWSPSFLAMLKQVTIRRASTFDSHATPKAGQARVQPKGFADIDLTALGERIAATVEKAKADDPKALRARIAELERALAAKPAPAAPPAPIEVKIPVMDADTLARLQDIGQMVTNAGKVIDDAFTKMSAAPQQVRTPTTRTLPARPGEAPATTGARPLAAPRAAIASRPAAPIPPSGEAPTMLLSKPQQKILDSLAWFAAYIPGPTDRTMLALFCGASSKSSTYGNNLGALRTAGMIDYPGRGTVALTDLGASNAQAPDGVSTSEELQAALFARLSGPQKRILEALITIYPDSIDRTDLAITVEASPTSSAYGNNLGALRTLGLLDYPDRGRVGATPMLFLDGR